MDDNGSPAEGNEAAAADGTEAEPGVGTEAQAEESASVQEEAKEEAPSPQPASPRYKFRVLDEDRELDHEEAQRLINQGHYHERGQEAFRKGAEMRRAVEFTVGRLTESLVPSAIELFQGRYNLSPAQAKAAVRAQVEAWLGQELQEEFADPAEKQKLQLERELASTKQRLAAREAREQETEREEQWSAALDQFASEFKKQGVADDSLSIRLLESVFQDAVDEGIRLTPAQYVARVKIEREKLVQGAMSKATPDELRRGAPDLLKQVRQEDIAKVRAARSQPGALAGKGQPAGKPVKYPRREISMAELREELSQL